MVHPLNLEVRFEEPTEGVEVAEVVRAVRMSYEDEVR